MWTKPTFMRFFTLCFLTILLIRGALLLHPAEAESGSNVALQYNALQDTDVVTVYSSRSEVQSVFDEFTEKTGVKVNLIHGSGDDLLGRIKEEGVAVQADLFLVKNLGTLLLAKQKGLLAAVNNPFEIENNIPEYARDPEGYWYGLGYDLLGICYAKDRVTEEELSSYAALVDKKWHGKILVGPSTDISTQMLLASIIQATGEEESRAWATGIVANMAGVPQNSGYKRLHNIAAGEADLAIVSNTVFMQLKESNEVKDRMASQKLGMFYPGKELRGSFININGGAITTYARNRSNAAKLLIFLSEKEVQEQWAKKSYSYPLHLEAKIYANLISKESFLLDTAPVFKLDSYLSNVRKILQKVGWR